MRIKLFLFLAGLLLGLAAACGSSEPATPTPTGAMGTITGTVLIGPLCPVEPCSTQVGDTYSSRRLQLRSEGAEDVPVFLDADGRFRAQVPAGRYEVNLSNCEFLGCSSVFPIEIEIMERRSYALDINVDTGIRSVVRPPMSLSRLQEELRNSGADVGLGREVNQPFFDVPGQVVTVDDAEIQVFEYPAVGDAQAAASEIGPGGGTIGTTSVMWVAPPHFYAGGTVIVLYVGDDDGVLELLDDALGSQIAGGEPTDSGGLPTLIVSPAADSTAREQLGARLGVSPADLVLVHSRPIEFSDGGMGCPDAGAFYTQAIIPGFVLLYEAEGTRYPFRSSGDGRLFTDCRRENNVAVPFRLADEIVRVSDAFELGGGGPSHLGPEVVLQTRAQAEAYLAESNGLVEMELDLVDWDSDMLAGTVITGSGCSFEVVTPLVFMQRLGRMVVVYVEAQQSGQCEKAWAQPVWLVVQEVPKEYSASFVLSYSVN